MQRRWRISPGRTHSFGCPHCAARNGHAFGPGSHGVGRAAVFAVLIIVVLLAIAPSAHCESKTEELLLDALDLNDVQKIGAEAGVDVSEVISALILGGQPFKSFDWNLLKSEAMGHILRDLRLLSSQLAVPILMSVLMRILLGKRKGENGVFALICRLCCAAALCTSIVQSLSTTSSMIGSTIRCTDALAPVIVTIYTLSGMNASGSAFSSLSVIAADLIQDFLKNAGVGLSLIAAGLSIGGNLSDKLSLKRMHRMSKDIFQWMIGIIMAGFMGMLTIQGRLGNVRDSAGMRTVKYAIESIIPVIGGDVSDSLGSVLSTAALVRSTIGAAGLILILIATIVPFVRIAAVMLLLKFTSALCEPIGDDGLGTMLGQGAEVHEMLLVTGAVSCLLCILLIGSCMTTTGRILY